VKLGAHYRAKQRKQAIARVGQQAKFPLMVASLSAAMFMWVWSADETVQPRVARAETEVSSPAYYSGVYYSGCREARAAGAAPLHVGEPGYRPEMDGDGDGVACEPYRRW
jgi:hypothetical protein